MRGATKSKKSTKKGQKQVEDKKPVKKISKETKLQKRIKELNTKFEIGKRPTTEEELAMPWGG